MEDLGAGPVALDTVAFVYFIEEHADFLAFVLPIFEAIDAGRLRGMTSTLTLLETLVVPYRAGDLALAERYEALLGRSRNLLLVEIDRHVLRAAAQLRARTRIKTPDAIQVAAALTRRCSTFVTNDRRLPPIPGLKIIELNAYASTPRA